MQRHSRLATCLSKGSTAAHSVPCPNHRQSKQGVQSTTKISHETQSVTNLFPSFHQSLHDESLISFKGDIQLLNLRNCSKCDKNRRHLGCLFLEHVPSTGSVNQCSASHHSHDRRNYASFNLETEVVIVCKELDRVNAGSAGVPYLSHSCCHLILPA